MKENDTTVKVEETEVVSSNKKEAVKKSESRKTEKVQANSEILVYCGPTIKGVVTQYAHFNNGLPKRLKEYSQQNKDIKRLIVPISNFVETRKNILVKGTIENISFIRIQEGE